MILREKHQLKPEDIAHIEGCISDIAFSVLPYGVPENRAEGLFSVPWCAAAALVDGAVTIETFSPETLLRSDLRTLAAKVSVTQHPRFPGLAFHEDHPDVTRITLTSGEVLEQAIAFPIGGPNRPLSPDDLSAKFFSCSKDKISAPKAKGAHDLLMGQRTSWPVEQLMTMLTKEPMEDLQALDA